MDSPKINNQTTLTFSWLGPSQTFVGRSPLDVRVLDLILENRKQLARVMIPEKLPLNTVRQISFQYRHPLQPHIERPVETLDLSIQEIQGLVIKAGYFEPSQRNPGSVLRTDRNVEIKLPSNALKEGEDYRLEIESSQDLVLAARICRDFRAERQEIFTELSATLLLHMSNYLRELSENLPDVEIVVRANFGDTGWAVLAVQKAIKQLKEADLLDLVKHIRDHKTKGKQEIESKESLPEFSERIADNVLTLYQTSLRKFFSFVGRKGIANIMDSYLHSIFLEPIHPKVAELIERAIAQFEKGVVGFCKE